MKLSYSNFKHYMDRALDLVASDNFDLAMVLCESVGIKLEGFLRFAHRALVRQELSTHKYNGNLKIVSQQVCEKIKAQSVMFHVGGTVLHSTPPFYIDYLLDRIEAGSFTIPHYIEGDFFDRNINAENIDIYWQYKYIPRYIFNRAKFESLRLWLLKNRDFVVDLKNLTNYEVGKIIINNLKSEDLAPVFCIKGLTQLVLRGSEVLDVSSISLRDSSNLKTIVIGGNDDGNNYNPLLDDIVGLEAFLESSSCLEAVGLSVDIKDHQRCVNVVDIINRKNITQVILQKNTLLRDVYDARNRQ